MKANFMKRVGAFFIDTMLLSIIFSIVTMGFTSNTNDINEELTDILEQYESSEITIYEYSNKVVDLNYELQKSSLVVNTLEVVLYIGYFIIFGYLNKGQTIGKKLCRIKVVNVNGDRPSILNMFVRSLFIYGITTLLFNVIFVNILNSKLFSYGFTIVTYLESIFMIICFFMVLYKKDGRGLHDIIGKTNVVEEVK